MAPASLTTTLPNLDSPANPEDPLPAPPAGPAGCFAAALLPLSPDTATFSVPALIGCVGGAALAGFGALAASCLIAYSPTRLADLLASEERPDRTQRIEEIHRRDREYLVVATAYTAAGWILGFWSLLQATSVESRPAALAAFVGTMLLAAGSLPFGIAQVLAERTLLAVLPAVRAGWFLLRWPLVLPLLGVTRLCLHLLGVRPSPTDTAEVQKQVLAAVADSVTASPLADEERTWIGNIIGLKDLQVSTVMTPRPDIVAFADSMPLREAVQKALEHGFSRYPVYRERIDEVVGVFYVKDALRLLPAEASPLASTPVRSMMREPLFVPETMGAAQLLRRFQAGNQHMAIVLDEYGTTAGLATVEDLIEQIVGDISDEYDSPEPEASEAEQIQVVEAGRVLEIPARTTVPEVNQLLGTQLTEVGDWETVAGMVIAKCNHIPTVGEAVVVDGVEFRVLVADERRLQRLRVTALAPEPAEGAS